ncbi:MAG: P-II family nitrogen regulator [Acetatifactor sp.]|nr:P-II family nitrogen regulator [Acetatifactor sp.]
MELYYVLGIVDRSRAEELQKLCLELQLSVVLTNFGRGTATSEHLRLYDLQPTEKAVVGTIVTASSMKQLMRAAKLKMFIDIPGNGIMMAIPIKSVNGGKNLAYFTDGQDLGGGIPDMNFKNELIVVILNEGHADLVMDAARGVGAAGGTILHAKGTGGQRAEKFFGVSLAQEKDMIYILAPSGKKSEIMKAINQQCGTDTQAGAICFSLPVSEAVGIRRLDEEG